MEIKREVKTFQIDFKCEVCDNGYMIATGHCLTSNPAQFGHQCNNPNCRAQKTVRGQKYPRVVTEAI